MPVSSTIIVFQYGSRGRKEKQNWVFETVWFWVNLALAGGGSWMAALQELHRAKTGLRRKICYSWKQQPFEFSLSYFCLMSGVEKAALKYENHYFFFPNTHTQVSAPVMLVCLTEIEQLYLRAMNPGSTYASDWQWLVGWKHPATSLGSWIKKILWDDQLESMQKWSMENKQYAWWAIESKH